MTPRELLNQSLSPRLEAELLLSHCLDRDRAWLFSYADHALPPHQVLLFKDLDRRRAAGEPTAYLLGYREFWNLRLTVTPDVLIPRVDSELLVEWGLELVATDTLSRVLDMGTGSGAIALAIKASQPTAEVYAVDRSERALRVARNNAQNLGLEVTFFRGDWFAGLPVGRFSLIVANPPYIAPGDPHLSAGDLLAEPIEALVSAEEGYADLYQIISGSRDRLEPGGWLLLEHGWEQGEGVRTALYRAGFQQIQTRLDLGGRERVSGGCL